jgi:hypothetical protein
MLRSVLVVAASVALGACFFNGNGQLQGDARDNGNGNGANNGNGNGNGNGTSSGFIETGETPSDGAWDITAAAGDAIGPSEFVLAGDTATGFIAKRGEGSPDGSYYWCTVTKDRNEFHLQASGNSLSGTFTVVTTWSGSGCPENQSRTVQVTGKRTSAGKNALDGTWALTVTDGGEPVAATLRVATAAGSVSATSSSSILSFAARRR